MARQLFGTDGIRGVAGERPLDRATISALGSALGEDLKAHHGRDARVLIGMDTRESSEWIAETVAGGLAAEGVSAQSAGVITTPGVAYLTRAKGFAAGVMISASHNPYRDNGIKVFAGTGYKLPDDEELEIEHEIFRVIPQHPVPSRALDPDSSLAPKYADYLLSTLDQPLGGWKVVLDCGNGAASKLAPELFRRAGAEVIAIHDEPNGRNINLDCGALHTESLAAEAVEQQADAGVAFDGDADRAILVSGSGQVIDGDLLLLTLARALKQSGRLRKPMVVATVMSNLGLELALKAEAIEMARTPVGDKYVLEEMLRRGAEIGGEQSGHVILLDYATTGDGMLTALHALAAVKRQGATLDELRAAFEVFPQKLVNVRIRERKKLEELAGVQHEIAAAEKALDGEGRVLVRFSGTEPLARVMVEARRRDLVDLYTGRIAAAIERELA